MRARTVAHPATIVSSLVGKLAEKPDQIGPDHQRRYRDIVAEFHTISRYKKFPQFEP